jgi:hypothetical protein
VITAASFPTPHLALRTNDAAEQDRIRAFAYQQADAAEQLRRRLVDADFPTMSLSARVSFLRRAEDELVEWRYQLALAAPGRLGVGFAADPERLRMTHHDGGRNYDRLGYTGRMRDGATWNPDTKTYRGGEETPASRIIEHYGQLAAERIDAEAPGKDVLDNPVRVTGTRMFTGNQLVRRAAAGRIAEELVARVAARGRDTSTMEVGGDPIYAISTDVHTADVFHGVAIIDLAQSFSADLRQVEKLETWQHARYLMFQSPRTKKGSDAVTRVFLVAVGAALFGVAPVMEQDVDLRCMVLGQEAAQDMPADDVLWNHIGRTLSGHDIRERK